MNLLKLVNNMGSKYQFINDLTNIINKKVTVLVIVKLPNLKLVEPIFILVESWINLVNDNFNPKRWWTPKIDIHMGLVVV